MSASASVALSLAVLWLIGSYALLFGILLVVLAFKVKGVARKLEARHSA